MVHAEPTEEMLATIDRLTPQWLAGFFDGEGCVCLRAKTNGDWDLRVNITQADAPLLAALAWLYRASYGPYAKTRKGRERLVYEIGWTGKGCEGILRVLLPHVFKKRRQVELALRFIEGMRGSGNYLSDSEKSERILISQQMRELNYAGPFKPNISPQVVDKEEFIQ